MAVHLHFNVLGFNVNIYMGQSNM